MIHLICKRLSGKHKSCTLSLLIAGEFAIVSSKPIGRPSLSDKAKGETRRDLLNAAETSFAKRGYAGTSVSEIARAAGITSSAVYRHFDSKADILLTIIRERRLHVGIDQAMKDTDALEPVAFAQMISSYIDADMHNVRQLILEIYRTALQDEQAAQSVAKSQLALRSAVSDGLRRSRDKGGNISQKVDTLLAADLMLVAAVGLSALEAINPDLVGDAKLKALLEDITVRMLRDS